MERLSAKQRELKPFENKNEDNSLMVAVQMLLLPEDKVSWCPVKWFLASQT